MEESIFRGPREAVRALRVHPYPNYLKPLPCDLLHLFGTQRYIALPTAQRAKTCFFRIFASTLILK